MKKWLLSAASLLLSASAWLQPLSGMYTIDPAQPAGGTNFQSFSAFTTDLNTNGVASAVTVNVKEGTYTEQISIGSITGASALNTVTIQSDPTNTNDVLVTFANTTSSEGTIVISGTKYVTFSGLTLENTGTTYKRLVYFDDNCGNITFANNVFNGGVYSNSNSINGALVYGTSIASQGEIKFDNNTFNNGTSVIYLTSTASTFQPKLTITNNLANGFTANAIYCNYVDTAIIKSNEFHQDPTNQTSYMTYFYGSTTAYGDYYEIEDNIFDGNTSGTFYGVYISYLNSSAANRSRIVNNMVSNESTTSTTGTRYGIYMYSGSNVDFYHNTISVADGSATAGRAAYFGSSTSTSITYSQGNYNVKNNIFANYGSGFATEIVTAAQGHFNTLNNNVYYGANPTPLKFGGTEYDFVGWQTASAMDANSVFGDPLFVSYGDLHVLGNPANDMGDNTVGITVDIDGDIRPASGSTMVDAGADEYTPMGCLPVSYISAVHISYNQAEISWDVNGMETMWNVEIVPAGQTPTGVGTSTTTNPHVFGSLNGAQTYDVYVQANCGGSTSTWEGPFTFTTICNPYVAPWVEPFTGATTPTCWTQEATTGGPWEFTGNPGATAAGTLDHTNNQQNNYAWIDYTGTDAGVILESPLIDVSALSVPWLRFWIWSHYDGTNLTVNNPTFVEAWDGTQWQQISMVQGDFGPQWKEFEVTLQPAYIFNGNLVKIRFRGESGGATYDYNNDILLDDVSITEAPTCPKPIDLTFEDGDTSSALISWTATGTETEWIVEWGPVGFAPGTGMSHSTTSNPDLITGLLPRAFYDVYVRAICGGGDTSFYQGPITFDSYGLGSYMEFETNCYPGGYIDITQTGASDDLDSDGEIGFATPFPFYYQGNRVDQMTIGNNGAVVFNTISGQIASSNTNTLETTAAVGLYPYWDDMQDDGGLVYFQTMGTAPNRIFVVQWVKKHDLYSSGDFFNYELIMEEATGKVYFQYENATVGSTSYDNGKSATIGISGTSQDYTLSFNNTPFLEENTCVEFYYTDCPKPADLLLQYITADEAAFTWTGGVSGEDTWTVVYGPSGFDPATSGTVFTINPSPVVILANLQQLTEYDIYVMAVCANGDTSRAIVGHFKTLPLCSDPTNFSLDAATDTIFANYNWTAFDPMYPATGFSVAYGNTGYTDPSDAFIFNGNAFPGDSVYDVNLKAGGVYQVYVQAICDTFESNWVGPVTITMPLDNDAVCSAETLFVDGVYYAFDNDGATIENNESSIAPPVTGAQTTDGWLNNTLSSTTWFKFTAPASGNMRIDARDIAFNGQVAIYSAITCADFASFTLLAANDDDLDGNSTAPNFTVCGLMPGAEYYLMYDSYSTTATGVYSLKLSEISLEAGSANPIVNVCAKEVVNLFDGISGNQAGGTWIDLDNTFHIVNDSLFNTNGVAYEVYNFEYRIEDGCASDAVTAQYQVYGPSQAGDNGSIIICKNEPFTLLNGLGGTISVGGQWYNAANAPISGPNVPLGTLNVPGNYNYQYIVGNGVCPDDSSIVTITVLGTCDFTSVEENQSNLFNIYPNPTSTEVNMTFIAVSETTYFELLDVNGKVLTKTLVVNGENTITLDVRNYEPGLYLIRMSNATNSSTQRVVIR